MSVASYSQEAGWQCGEANLFSSFFQPSFQTRRWGEGTLNKIQITQVIQEEISVSEVL